MSRAFFSDRALKKIVYKRLSTLRLVYEIRLRS